MKVLRVLVLGTLFPAAVLAQWKEAPKQSLSFAAMAKHEVYTNPATQDPQAQKKTRLFFGAEQISANGTTTLIGFQAKKRELVVVRINW